MSYQSWIGRTIGNRYQLNDLLGAGGMSAVYRAVDPNLRRVVAVKLIHPHLSVNPNFVERFKEEAAAVASLRHPNIVQVHDFDHEGETYFMVMEYLAGETLQARLRRIKAAGRNLPLEEAMSISLQICDAAGYAHRHDLIHRDIKPANIMLDVHKQAILMDFGIVKIVGGQYHTATGATIGTAIYMSPEQIRSERVDERSDIYSMGVMLFEMLSGHPPFEADSALTLMMMHLNDPIPNPTEMRSDVPPELAAVVVKALAKESEQRYQTAAEMAADLTQIQFALNSASNNRVVEKQAPFAEYPTNKTPPATSANDMATQEATNQTPEVVEAIKRATEETVHPTDDSPLADALTQPETEAEFSVTSQEKSPIMDSEGQSSQEHILHPDSSTLPAETSAKEGQFLETGLASAEIETHPTCEAVIPIPIEGQASERAQPIKKRTQRRTLRLLLAATGVALLLVLVVTATWFLLQRRPPSLLLMSIEHPSTAINLESYPRLVSLGKWFIDSRSNALTFSPDSLLLATTSNRERVRFSPYHSYASLWQVEPGQLQSHLSLNTNWINNLDFSPNGSLLATVGESAKVNLWQVSDGELLSTIESEIGPLNEVDFAPDGKLLAGASWDSIGLWQISNGNLLRNYLAGEDGFSTVTFSPDGDLIAGGSYGGKIYIWRFSSGELLVTLDGHTAEVIKVTFSPDGELIASASADFTIGLWQVNDGSLIHRLNGHSDGVTDLAFSPDGSLLASSSWDNSLRLWQVSNGISLRSLEMDDSVSSLAFSPDGAWLACGVDDGTISFWGISQVISQLKD